MLRKLETALYGNIAIPRAYCSDCESMAFVLDGKMACCDKRVGPVQPKKIKRVIEPELVRRIPTGADRNKILEAQNNSCFYCERRFGSRIIYKNKERILSLRWDHIVPWVFSQNNRPENFIAACQICNGVKLARMFDSVEDLRIYVLHEIERKGFRDVKDKKGRIQEMPELQCSFRN